MADTSIYNSLLKRPKSIADYDAEAMQGQTNRLTLQMNQAKMADYQREQADEQTMRGAVASFGADKTANYNALLKTGNLKAAQGYEKQNADTAKVQREAEKEAFTVAKQKLELFNNAIAGAVDQNSYSQQRQILAAQGIDVSQIPEQFDPGYVQAAKVQALTELQRVEQFGKERKFDQDERKFKYQQTNDEADRGVQVRGQNMTAKSAAVGHRLKADENAINRAGIVGKRTQDVEMKLQDDYRAESKGFGETSTAMKKILGAISTADKNPGSALAAGTAFMKILDPNSVVRESELGMALNASGWFDRATNIATTLQSGRVMTKTQQQNLKAASEDLFEEAKAAQREVDSAYKKRATDYGADPERVIVNRGQNTGRGGTVAPVRITSDAEYAKIPSGALFITPDGKTRRKP